VTQVQLAAAYAAMVNGGVLVKPHVVTGQGGAPVAAGTQPSLLQAGMSPVLAGLLDHVLASPWYDDKSRVPGYWVGGKTGTAQVWDAELHQWEPNTFNFSSVGFIGRQQGHPDLIIAVRLGDTHPDRNAAGQLVLSINSTELFRRVATDAVTTPGLLPVLAPTDGTTAQADR
jgi:cell division protein FtsI/penicillin-binding protein 2